MSLPVDTAPYVIADAPAEWYRKTLEGLLFQALSPLLAPSELAGGRLIKLLQAPSLPPPSVPHSRQKYQHPPPIQEPVGLPVEKDRIHLQVNSH